jgi:uncharacterized protein
MATKIMISIQGLKLEATLNDGACAAAIAAALPFETRPNAWGDEFYFEIPIEPRGLDATAKAEVEIGDIGYWPPGNALAIFFGPTPMSDGPDPVAASPVNVVGSIAGDPALLKRVKGAAKIGLSKA